MPNYGRYLSIVAGPATYNIVDGVGAPGLRCRFTAKLGVTLGYNTATVRVTNPLPETAQMIAAQQATNLKITIDAGYQDNHGLIFSGEIKQAVYGRDSQTDTVLTMYCADSHTAHNFGVVNKSLAAGSTPQDHVNAAVQAMAAVSPTPVSLGYVDPALILSQPSYPRGVALYGMARDTLWNVARSKQANVFVDQGQVKILGYANSIPGDAVVLNSRSGLIGMPSLESGGIMVRSQIMPQIKMGGQIQVDQSLIQISAQPLGPNGEIAPNLFPSKAADGFYKVLTIIYDGDSRGTPWYADLGCRAASGAGPTPAALLNSPANNP